MLNKVNVYKKFALCLTAILLMLSLPPAYAWSFTGHVIIAQIAYDNLTLTARQKADKLAAIIYSGLGVEQQQKLDGKFKNASTFAKIASIPDIWRKWHFGTILHRFNAPCPNAMQSELKASTQGWHFINLPYPQHSQNAACPMPSENVVQAMTKLEQAFDSARSANTQAVLMVLEEHYMGDIHQPLHTLTRISTGCQGDEGGNSFCIRYSKSGQCTKNLHTLWDSAVGYVKPKENIQSAAYKLETLYPKANFTTQLKDNNPMNWAKANYAYARFIYSLPEGQKPTPQYYQQGQGIAKKQLALAGYRLAQLINNQIK